MFTRHTVLATACASMFAVAAQGAVIANYDFTDPDTDSNHLESVDTDAQSDAGDLTFGAGIQDHTVQTSGSQNGLSFGNPLPGLYIDSSDTPDSSESAAEAISQNQSISFVITSVGPMTLTNLSLDWAVFAGEGGSGKRLDVIGFVRSSLTGTTDLLSWDDGTGGDSSIGWFPASVDLTDGGTDDTFENINSVTFTIYLADNKNQGGRGHGLDNIQVEGTTVIPEPASLALLGLGGLMMVSRRNRR